MRKKNVVLASGAFDLLHLGHVKYLEEAKRSGGEEAKLIVIVARDNTFEKMKGKKPVMSEDQRRALVESLRVVDEAILGYGELDINGVIEKIKPDIIAVGYDQSEVERHVRKAISKKGLPIKILKIGRFGKEELNSSSEIKRKIIEAYK